MFGETRNKKFMETEIAKAKKHFEKEEYLQSLSLLDRIIENSKIAKICYLRALLREQVNDLTGSLSDIGNGNLDHHCALTRTRILAKLGFVEESACLLRTFFQNVGEQEYSYWVSLAVGIVGRRFDLELIGIKPEQKNKISTINKDMRGCVLEHLIALGEFVYCRQLFGSASSVEFSRMSILNEIEKIDELQFITVHDELLGSVERAVKGIRGWLSLDEAIVLAALARRVLPGEKIVEVGSFLGRSSCALALGSEMGSLCIIHAVDTHAGLPGIHSEGTLSEFKTNLRVKKFTKTVIVHQGSSTDIANSWKSKTIGLLFIDGNHDYKSVKNDFESWLPHLSQGGLIAFHDSAQLGPNKLLTEIIQNNSRSIHMIGLRDSLSVFQLVQKNSEKEIDLTRRNTWIKYLTILGQNYSTWIKLEKARFNRDTTEQFNQIMNNLASIQKLEHLNLEQNRDSQFSQFGDY